MTEVINIEHLKKSIRILFLLILTKESPYDILSQ
jgi:hypothetical protein